MSDSIAVVSGGLDSTTLVYEMLADGFTPHLLSFDYGQRHLKELEYAARTAEKFNLRHDIIDLSNITHLISNSALTAGQHKKDFRDENELVPAIDVPEGHYAEDNMKTTVVPNRNMIMISIAAGVAVNEGAEIVAVGVHAGDHFIYPDCRPEFIDAAGKAVELGNKGFSKFAGGDNPIFAPFISMSKADIAFRAIDLGVPFESTWSCYKGGEMHCGRCGTCVERLEAIDTAQKRWEDSAIISIPWPDRTEYADFEYWKEAVKNA